ncbi:MAG: N-acetylmuramoyl-L-alanine amidase [Bacilli bacterium]
MGKVIYLDPGHGGMDPGAMYKNIMEKDINLAISKKLQMKLENMGAIVYLTRYGDYDLAVNNTSNRKRSDLSRRGNVIDRSKCDLYVSIHLNAELSSTWHGAQVFYDGINAKNKKIAEIMQDEFATSLKSARKYKKITDIYLNKRVKSPGVLLEVGFLSNPNERYLLTSDVYQNKVSNAIASGMIKYLIKSN